MKSTYVDCIIEELKNLGGVVRLTKTGERRQFSMFDVMADTKFDHMRVGDRARWRTEPTPGLSDPHPERWQE